MADERSLDQRESSQQGAPLSKAMLPQDRKRVSKPTYNHKRRVEASRVTYRIDVPEGVLNRSVTLSNTGTEIVVQPRVVVNEQRNWFSTADILAEILNPDMSDREKALSIWQFLVVNRYHDEPAHNDIEIHDPVRFLNVYGYGFCDDSATNFMVLAERAGLPARVWGLSGHVVPEVYFDGGWHMLDPDGEVYYLDDDGETLSSVQTLEKRPDIIRKYPSPFYTQAEKLVDIYTTTEDNGISEWYRGVSESRHTMAYVLRPGESLTRHGDNWGLYFASHFLSEPRRYGNGQFVFEPVWKDNIYVKGARSADGFRVERQDTSWVLVAKPVEGVLAYHFISPYPYLDGRVVMTGEGDFAVACSESDVTWVEAWRSEVKAEAVVRLGGQFRNGHGRPMYSIYVKVAMTGVLRSLRFELDIQVAPLSLPRLEPGENSVLYLDGSNLRQVEIEFGYDLESVGP
ncbi:MAG: transglutaminase-like domain-containing protein [bacterium]|nr:transglutaminase-like domain-containing protein [bacterium]